VQYNVKTTYPIISSSFQISEVGPSCQGGYSKPVINPKQLLYKKADVASQTDGNPRQSEKENGNGFDIPATLAVSHCQV
jgi:hypothetical protein